MSEKLKAKSKTNKKIIKIKFEIDDVIVGILHDYTDKILSNGVSLRDAQVIADELSAKIFMLIVRKNYFISRIRDGRSHLKAKEFTLLWYDFVTARLKEDMIDYMDKENEEMENERK